MIGRKGRQECLPPWQECLQSYICKPANYQPPALIELLFDNLIARQGRNPAPKGHRPLTRFLKRKALVPWCPRFGAGENLQGTASLARVPALLTGAPVDMARGCIF